MIDMATLAQVITGILMIVVALFGTWLKKHSKKLFRIAEAIVKVFDALSDLEDLQRHMIEDISGLLAKMSEGEAPTQDEVEHVLQHCKQKYELAQELYRALKELKEAIVG